ncbi:MAG TPA: zinc-dependent metalloprotease [Fimbriiglobus sp.]|nr:zinc-dependent metalloprotease [Fimbriiglobus sp.]
MFARLLLIAALAGLAGTSADPVQAAITGPAKKDEPKKPKKDEPKKKPKGEPKKKEEAKGPVTAPGGKGKAAPKRDALKKYDDVITKDAKTQPGVFAVHTIDDKVYFEVPADKLGKLMMFRAEVARGPSGTSFNGMALGTKFVRFERHENKLQVIEAAFDKRSRADTRAAVEASATEPIIASFRIEAEGKDRSAVITATNLIMQDSLDVGAKRAGGFGGMIDSERSYLQEIKAFPTNIEARALLTLRGGGGGRSFGSDGPSQPSFGGSMRTSTVVVHYSLFALPDEPMTPRFFDPRVGYFTEGYADYSSPKTWVTEKELIARFRLEKKDPKAEVSEPVKPITFYLSPEIPEKYREAMKKGVEAWQPAFEKAGFKNAIVCKDPPSRTEDPNWDPEDARYSVIRWVAEPVANAMGPHVHDPRSGEIISAHVIVWHDILKIVQLWYFVQCSAVDERARKLPLPDDLTCDLIRYVTTHEVGHTLGLRHNHRASQAYSIEDLRDPEFAAKYGPVASIMSYGRFNYVAQPEDKVAPKDLIPKIAPYDLFAIAWGYKPIPGASSPEAEKPTLDEWAGKQAKEPNLRFGGEDGPSMVDPTVLTENIGSDPVKATELGLKNMDRVLGYLVEATTVPGEDFEVLQDAYSALMMHRRNWFNAVAKQVGGVKENRTLAGPGRGQQFSRVDVKAQKAAVKFLIENCFTTPRNMLDPDVVNQFKFSGVASDVMGLQRSVLSSLLRADRLNRLLDAEVIDPNHAFPVSELVAEVQAGVWSELKADAPKTDPLRRNLQRAYIEILKKEFEPQPEGGISIGRLPRGLSIFNLGPSRSAELRAVARISLRNLAKQIEAALPKVKDTSTRAHLQDSLAEIADVLENNGGKKKSE